MERDFHWQKIEFIQKQLSHHSNNKYAIFIWKIKVYWEIIRNCLWQNWHKKSPLLTSFWSYVVHLHSRFCKIVLRSKHTESFVSSSIFDDIHVFHIPPSFQNYIWDKVILCRPTISNIWYTPITTLFVQIEKAKISVLEKKW